MNHLKTRLAELSAQYDRAFVNMIKYRDTYQSLRDTDTPEEDAAHRRYRIWETKTMSAQYGIFQVNESIRCLKLGIRK